MLTFDVHVAGGGIGVGLGAVVARHRHLHRLYDELVLLSVTQHLDAARDDRSGIGYVKHLYMPPVQSCLAFVLLMKRANER